MLAGLDAIGGFVSNSSEGGGTGGSFSVSVSPGDVFKTGSGKTGAHVLTTGPVTATVSGGDAPYTYLWARVSGDADIAPVAPTGASTAFSASCFPDDSFEASFTCTVTDAAGMSIVSDPVTASITLVGIGGP